MKKRFFENRAITILGISFLWCVFQLLIFAPFWETNDEFWMGNLASGALGTPTEYVVFMHRFLGILLKGLYGIFPDISWMGVLLEAIVFLSFTGILWAFSENQGSKRGILLWIFFMGMFAYSFYSVVNFTRVSAVATAAGYLVVFQGLRDKRWGPVLAGILLNWTGYMVRENSWFMVTALAGGVGLAELFGKIPLRSGIEKIWKSVKEQKHYFLIFLILFAGVLLLKLDTERYIARNPEVQQYVEFNQLRAQLMDYPTKDYEEISGELEELGVSRAVYEGATQNFIHYDPEQLDNETMKEIYQLQDSGQSNSPAESDPFFLWLVGRRAFVNCLICLGLGIFLADKRRWFLLAWQGIAIVGLNWYLFSKGRNPDRVFESICAVAGIYLLWAIGKRMVMSPARVRVVALGGILLAVAVNSKLYLNKDNYVRSAVNQEMQQISQNIQRLAQQDYYYVADITCDGFAMMQCGIEGINTLPAGSRDGFFFTGGWLVNHPQQKEAIEEAGTENIYRALFTRDDFFLIDQYGSGNTFQYIQNQYADAMEESSWSVCDQIGEETYLIAFAPQMQWDEAEDGVLTIALESREEDILWYVGDWEMPESDSTWYLQLEGEKFLKTYRILPYWQDGSWQFKVGIPSEDIPGTVTQARILEKTDQVTVVAQSGRLE